LDNYWRPRRISKISVDVILQHQREALGIEVVDQAQKLKLVIVEDDMSGFLRGSRLVIEISLYNAVSI
jgi:hypothetical protein